PRMNGADAAQTLDVARYYAGGWTLLPEYIVGLGAAAVLVLDAFKKGPRPAHIALVVLAAAVIASLFVGGGESVSLYSGMVVVDPFARFFRILFLFAGILGVVLTMQSDEVSSKLSGEYYSLFLGLVIGMMLMAEASDIVMVYLSLELV